MVREKIKPEKRLPAINGAFPKRAGPDNRLHPTIALALIEDLKPPQRNARTHPRAQIEKLADSIRVFGFICPIVVDSEGRVIAGYGRLQAAKLLSLSKVPVVRVDHLTKAQQRAFALADNRIQQDAGWDRQILAEELPELAELLLAEGYDLKITGFDAVEIDQLAMDFESDSKDPVDDIDTQLPEDAITKPGDIWVLGSHRLACGDARDKKLLSNLMKGAKAAAAFCDPPYNVPIENTVGRGRTKHKGFAMANGEMDKSAYVAFLRAACAAVVMVSKKGAVHYWCSDWRHISELIEAGSAEYEAMLNLAVWIKRNAGQGSFLRSQHELIAVFRIGNGGHLNNVQLGRHGRNRSNVWSYPNATLGEMKSHPTVKPVAMIADAIRDCTRRGDIVIDTFSGFGSTLMAAERVGRVAICTEIEPRFVDAAIRRWEHFTKRDAYLRRTGQTFHDVTKLHYAAKQNG